MELSEIRKFAEENIKLLFKEVIKSNDKDLWKEAISVCDQRCYIANLNGNIISSRIWGTTKGKLANKFKNKFIKPMFKDV